MHICQGIITHLDNETLEELNEDDIIDIDEDESNNNEGNNANNNTNEGTNEDDRSTEGPMMSQVDLYDSVMKKNIAILLLSDLRKKIEFKMTK